MDRRTVDVYEEHIDQYLRRDLRPSSGAKRFRAKVRPGRLRLDLGSGPGHMTGALGSPVVAVDAAWSMISRVDSTPLRVQADLEHVPFGAGSLHGTWASKCLQHVPAERLPMALAGLHRAMAVGAPLDLVVFEGDGTWRSDDDSDLPGRMFWEWPRDRLVDVVQGAGFTDVDLRTAPARNDVVELHVSAVRDRTLPDFVGPGMRVLVCGLNPSVYSADRGFGYAGPSNRFWKAALAAGLVSAARDPWRALTKDRVGMTDVVKRATPRASELDRQEYRVGAERVERLLAWLQPRVVVFVGLEGWRAAVAPKAKAGLQPTPFGGVPAYVMPSTSGLNAHASLSALTEHLQEVVALAPAVTT